jgi:hypothetical protein
MPRAFNRPTAAGVVIFFALALSASPQAGLSLKDVLRKNLEASGGKARLAQVKNLSFMTGGTRNVVSAAGELKILTGKDPVVTEVVLVRGDKVQRNAFNTISDITGPQKAIYQTLARLYAGLFSLAKFDGQLRLEGLKAYGPEKLYHLTTKAPVAGLAVSFFVSSADFHLKRLLFQGKTPDGDKYEVNYDFALFEDAEGLSLPLSWFASQVGTRGNMTEITEVKTNQPLVKDFFATLETNVGKTEVAPGEMKGNILDFNSSPFGLSIVTNWTKKDVEKAGLKTGDQLMLLIDEDEFKLAFYASASELPPPNQMAKGARILAPMPRGGEAFAVQIIGGDTAPIMAKLKALAPVSVKKISN